MCYLFYVFVFLFIGLLFIAGVVVNLDVCLHAVVIVELAGGVGTLWGRRCFCAVVPCI